MGMGEPLQNYRNVLDAIGVLSEMGATTPKNVTLSTVGVAPRILAMAREAPEVRLALSLHAVSEKLRGQLLPVASPTWPLGDLADAVRTYLTTTKSSIYVEYIMLSGVNDTEHHAEELCRWLTQVAEGEAGGPAKLPVNLIPYNRTEAGDRDGFEAPTVAHCKQFRSWVRSAGVPCTIRFSTRDGSPIEAACGQLGRRLQRRGSG
mmetsp:Transcript_54955/g.120485  ORF Transcript_54955/g.120485 Transcript_54955/m.120485 type:complete len:205 (-) Transcript_54955:1-615(-)